MAIRPDRKLREINGTEDASKFEHGPPYGIDKVKVEALASRRRRELLVQGLNYLLAALFCKHSLDSPPRRSVGRERPDLCFVSRRDSLRGALPRFFAHGAFARCEKEVRLDTVLLRVQVVVTALGGVERPVSPALDDPPRFHHQNLLRAADGGEAVRDHEGRAAPHQVREPLLNQR